MTILRDMEIFSLFVCVCVLFFYSGTKSRTLLMRACAWMRACRIALQSGRRVQRRRERDARGAHKISSRSLRARPPRKINRMKMASLQYLYKQFQALRPFRRRVSPPLALASPGENPACRVFVTGDTIALAIFPPPHFYARSN